MRPARGTAAWRRGEGRVAILRERSLVAAAAALALALAAVTAESATAPGTVQDPICRGVEIQAQSRRPCTQAAMPPEFAATATGALPGTVGAELTGRPDMACS